MLLTTGLGSAVIATMLLTTGLGSAVIAIAVLLLCVSDVVSPGQVPTSETQREKISEFWR